MAEIQKAIKIGDIYTNLVEPSTGKSVNYKEVTDWYDGTPMDDSKVDGELYRKVENTYVRKVIDKDGELFLEKETMDEMRNLSSLEVLMLKAGVYKGVTLNGYYEKGDTPTPIDYYLSDTTEDEDGGSVVEVASVKLEHIFTETINSEYFGLNESMSMSDVVSTVQTVFNFARDNNIKQVSIQKGEFVVNRSVVYQNSDSKIEFKGILKLGDGQGTTDREVQVINFSCDNVDVINLKVDGNRVNNIEQTSDNRGTQCDVSSYRRNNIKFIGGWVVNSMQSGVHLSVDNLTLDNFIVENSGEHNIYFHSHDNHRPTDNVNIKKCIFRNWGLYKEASAALAVREYKKIIIDDSTFDPTDSVKPQINYYIRWTINRINGISSYEGIIPKMFVNNCSFYRGNNSQNGFSFHIYDLEPVDKELLIKRGAGIDISNSYLEAIRYDGVYKVFNSDIKAFDDINWLPYMLEGNRVSGARSIISNKPEIDYKDYIIRNNIFNDFDDVSRAGGFINVDNSSKSNATFIIEGNTFIGFTNQVNFGIIRSTTGNKKLLISNNSFVDCEGVWMMRIENQQMAVITNNQDLNRTSKGIRLSLSTPDSLVEHNNNMVSKIGDSAPVTEGLYYENMMYYNTDFNMWQIYRDGQWKDARTPPSPDSADNIGDEYDKEEVQSILDELRDLKTKMRTAGLLAE